MNREGGGEGGGGERERVEGRIGKEACRVIISSSSNDEWTSNRECK